MAAPVPEMPNPHDEELRQALGVVCSDYSKPSPEIPNAEQFGDLFLLTDEERAQGHAVRNLISQYAARPKPLRPLSLAVFGPPGSGKSFAVKQILKQLNLTPIEVNLTQVSDASSLSELLARTARSPNSSRWWKKHSTGTATNLPVIFFDEFDAPKDGAPFGWLAWFLAPMQDGKFLHNGEVIELPRAVYVFAGGTAATMDQFANFAQKHDFQRAKGPDFISRLRGYLDVCGPNEEPLRMLRRAILFRSELKRAIGEKAADFRPDPEFMRSLLQAGRYRHGARSIAAVVDLSNLEGKAGFKWEDLPTDHLLSLHIDRGPLDAKLIGGSIAFSGYDKEEKVRDAWRTVARTLWNQGATLSYAGRWAQGERGWLMQFLQDELQKRPPEPSADQDRRNKPNPWLENFLDEREHRAEVDAAMSAEERNRIGLKVTFAAHITDEERAELGPWLSKGVEHFRRRLAITDASVARFVIAGATSDYNGRFPGIPEEVMLTLAQGKPVYITGAFGGSAAEVGSLLGLAHPRRGDVPPSLRAEPKQEEDSLSKIEHKLRPGPWTELPIRATDLASFLKAYALGGAKWPDNGLTFEENRLLFASNSPTEIANLVRDGLLRLFAKSDPATAEP